MITNEFKMELCPNEEYNIYVETFTSTVEALATILDRPLVHSMHYSDDYLHRRVGPSNPRKMGFKTVEELEEFLNTGLTDLKFIDDTIKYAYTATVQDKDVFRSMKRSVAGCSVCIPSYLSGNPACMWMPRKSKHKSKMIKIALDIGVHWGVEKKDYEAAGRAVAKEIVKLEKAGYRVRYHTLMSAAGRDANHHRKAIVMQNIIKTEGQPLNFARMLYPVCSTSYWRGFGFNWLVTCPEMIPDYNLGRCVPYMMDYDHKEELMQQYVDRICGPGFVPIVYSELVSKAQYEGQEAVEMYLDGLLMG